MDKSEKFHVYLDTNVLANFILLTDKELNKENLKKYKSLFDKYYVSVSLITKCLEDNVPMSTSTFCLTELNEVLFETAVSIKMLEENIALKYLNEMKKDLEEGRKYSDALYQEFFMKYISSNKIKPVTTTIDIESAIKNIATIRKSGIDFPDAIVCQSALLCSNKVTHFVSSDSRLIKSLKENKPKILDGIVCCKTEEMLSILKSE